LLILFSEPTLFNGRRTIRLCSAKRLKDGLANPPNGVRDEFETAGFVETLGRFDEAEVAFVDKVGEAKALILILFCYRNNEAQVGFGQFFEGYLVALFDPFCQIYFFFRGQQVHFPNFLQVLFKRLAFTVGDGLRNFKLPHVQSEC
jgi:hypothetical protein